MAIWHEEYELYRKYVHNIARFYKQNEQIRNYLELSLSLGAIIIFLAFAIRPTVVTITEKVKEMQSKQETLAKLNAKVDSLSVAETLLRQEESTVSLLETAIPRASTPEDQVAQIEALARRSNVTLESMLIEKTPIKESTIPLEEQDGIAPPSLGLIRWFPFTVVVRGNYEDLYNFSTNIENFRRSMKINNAVMEESELGGIQFSITGEVPYYHNNE